MPTSLRAVVTVGVAVWTVFASAQVLARTWTNDEGQTLEAEFVRIRGTSLLLRDADRKIIPAPISRLSEEDVAWLERYRELAAPREWGEAKQRGRFVLVREGRAEIKILRDLVEIPFEELTVDDLQNIEAHLNHTERPVPDDLASARRDAEREQAKNTPPAVLNEREWTDGRGRSISAVYGGFEAGQVVLWRQGKRFEFPLEKLSAEDQTWIAQRGASQFAGDLLSGAKTITSLGSMIAMKAYASGNPPPMPRARYTPRSTRRRETREPRVASRSDVGARHEEEEVSATETQNVSATPVTDRGAPPWINSVNDLSPNELERRLREAFGSFVDGDTLPAGLATCTQCGGEFGYPESYSAGDSCPFCGVAIATADLEPLGDLFDLEDGSSRPWHQSRWVRRLVVAVVLAVIGLGYRTLKFGGGGGVPVDDDEEYEDEEDE